MDDPKCSIALLSTITVLTALTMMSRNSRNLLERKDAVRNSVAKDLSLTQIVGRGDGTIMSTGVSTIPSA